MKYTFFFLGLLVLFSHMGVSQNTTFTLSLYYEINEVSSQVNFARLDSLYATFEKSPQKLNIYGYADFLNTATYNQNLSQKRANAVKTYLLKKGDAPLIQIILCKGEGENNSTDNQSMQGEPVQRRVDVIVIKEFPSKKIGTHDNVIQEEPTKEPATETKNIEDLKKGETLAIEGLSFIPGRHLVTESALPAMKKLLQTLKDHPGIKVEIQGHVCCPGDGLPDGLDYDTREYKLSENRAKAIYDFLIKNGIEENRLTYKGYGRSHPKVAIETTLEDEQMNRRVEIKILEN